MPQTLCLVRQWTGSQGQLETRSRFRDGAVFESGGRPDFNITDGPNFKTGGPSGYNWEIARGETENL